MGVKVPVYGNLQFSIPSGERYQGVLEGLAGRDLKIGELLVSECLELEGLRGKLLEHGDATGFVFVSRELNRIRLSLLALGKGGRGSGLSWLFSEEQRDALERSKYGD